MCGRAALTKRAHWRKTYGVRSAAPTELFGGLTNLPKGQDDLQADIVSPERQGSHFTALHTKATRATVVHTVGWPETTLVMSGVER